MQFLTAQGALARVTRQLSALIGEVARGRIRFSSWNFELILFSAFFFEVGIIGHSADLFFAFLGLICFSSWN